MVVNKSIKLKTEGNTDIINITGKIARLFAATKLKDGLVTVFIPGATGGLTTIEYEPGLLNDFKKVFERLAPRDGHYEHNKKWGDENGFSHVRASLLGPSISIPFSGGSLILGRWQQVVFIDFDNRPRSRELVVQFVGEK